MFLVLFHTQYILCKTKQYLSVTQAGHSLCPASAASASGLASHNITVLLCGENKIYLEIQKLQSAMGWGEQSDCGAGL